jgi:hypothetical protein
MISTELNYGFLTGIFDAGSARYYIPTEFNLMELKYVIIRDDGNSGAGNSFVCQMTQT